MTGNYLCRTLVKKKMSHLLEALEFYADPTTYHDDLSRIVQDHGKQARIALGRPATPDYTKLAIRVGDTVAAIETALNDKNILVSTIDNYTFLAVTITLKNVRPDYMREAKRVAREVANKHLPEFNVWAIAESIRTDA